MYYGIVRMKSWATRRATASDDGADRTRNSNVYARTLYLLGGRHVDVREPRLRKRPFPQGARSADRRPARTASVLFDVSTNFSQTDVVLGMSCDRRLNSKSLQSVFDFGVIKTVTLQVSKHVRMHWISESSRRSHCRCWTSLRAVGDGSLLQRRGGGSAS